MQNLIPLFRRASLNKHFLAPMLRGAKKKGKVDTGSTEPESNDIINIFKDKTDPEIKDMKDYPPWLTELMNPKKNLSTVMSGMMYNIETEKLRPHELSTFFIQLNRYKIIDHNKLKAMKKANYEIEDPFDYSIDHIVTGETAEAEEEEEEEGDEEDEEPAPTKKK